MNEFLIRYLGDKKYSVFYYSSGEQLYSMKLVKVKLFLNKVIICKTDASSALGYMYPNILTKRKWKYFNQEGINIGQLKFQWNIIGKKITLSYMNHEYEGKEYIKDKFILKEKRSAKWCLAIIKKSSLPKKDFLIEDYSIIPIEFSIISGLLIDNILKKRD